MDCSWCGKSTIYFNHDRCWDDFIAAEIGPLPDSVDPWGAMLLGEEVPDA